MVISIKKFMETDFGQVPPPTATAEELLPVVQECYRAALLVVGKIGMQVCPTTGAELQHRLAELEQVLGAALSPAQTKEAESGIEQQLQAWGGNTAEYFKAKANEVKDLLIVLARTAESVGERDQRYAKRFTELTVQLRSIANLEDLGQVRSSLVQRATELKSYVDHMSEESKKSVAQLQAELTTYEARLKTVEELVLRDELTGLANRRNVEERILSRIANQQLFTLVILDLNGFKSVNDAHGHLAGDCLLKQFSQELRGCIRSSDIVGRWSGDEFVVILDSDIPAAQIQLERVRKWVFGDYSIPTGAGKNVIKIHVDAAIGMARWQPGQSLQELIESADAAMYEHKKLAKKARV